MPSRRVFLTATAAGSLAPFLEMAQTQPPGSLGPVLGPGEHLVNEDMTIDHDIVLLPGARIAVAEGRTLQLRGDMQAPCSHIFAGKGAVDLNHSRIPEAWPEWWGAAPDDDRVDSLPALDACVAAHPFVRLLQGRYYVSNTWKIQRANRRVWGANASPLGRPHCTEIVLTDGSKDVIQIGLDSFPGSPDRFPEGIDVRWLRATRSKPVLPVPIGREDQAPAGIRFQFVLRGNLEDVASTESSIGFVVRGTARSFIRRCEVLRTRPGVHQANDFFWGFYFDGNVRIGFAGGNASIYVTDCFAKIEGSPRLTRSVGAYLRGGFCDTFLHNFEVGLMDQGILADGSADDPDRGLQKTGNADLHIHTPILDGLTVSGIELTRLTDYALVEIVDPYVATVDSALAAIHFHDCKGQTTITGGQLLGPGGKSIGVHVVDAEGLALRGLKIREFGRPVGMTNARDFEVDVAISNPEVRAMQGAIWLRNCGRGTIKARVKGRTGAFPQGVYLESGNQHVAVDVTGIDPNAVEDGAANMLVDGTRQIRTQGAFGTNLAQGIFE